MKRMNLFMAVLLLAFAGGCLTPEEPANPVVTLRYDADYVPAIGNGFRWTVSCEPEYLSGEFTLHLSVDGREFLGTINGLPSEIYVGWINRELVDSYYLRSKGPEALVPLKLSVRLPDSRLGSEPAAFVAGEEGRHIFLSENVVLTRESSGAPLVEFDVPESRLGRKPPADEELLIWPARPGADYDVARSVKITLKPVDDPSVWQWPVAELEQNAVVEVRRPDGSLIRVAQ